MTTNQTFGAALEAAKNGKAISREGWNGKGMIVFLNKGAHSFPASEVPMWEETCYQRTPFLEGIRSDLFENWMDGIVTRLPNLNMRAASGATVTGWLASQTDLLAEDWCIHD